MKKFLLALACSSALVYPANAQSILSYDGLATWPSGIRGNTITAAAVLPGENHPSLGVVFNLATATWNVLSPSPVSVPYGPSVNGRLTVGMMQLSGIPTGYIINNITGHITTLSVPGYVATVPHSVYDGEVVGSSWLGTKSTAPAGPADGFAYKAGTYTNIKFPGSYNTELYGIWGNIVAGTYRVAPGTSTQGFLYNQATGKYVSYDFPGATSTTFHGISAGSRPGSVEITGVMTIAGKQEAFAMSLGRNGRLTWIPVVVGVRTSGNSIQGNTIVGVSSAQARGHASYQGYSVNVNISARNPSAVNVAGSCSTSIKEECVTATPAAPAAGGGAGSGSGVSGLDWSEQEFRYW